MLTTPLVRKICPEFPVARRKGKGKSENFVARVQKGKKTES